MTDDFDYGVPHRHRLRYAQRGISAPDASNQRVNQLDIAQDAMIPMCLGMQNDETMRVGEA